MATESILLIETQDSNRVPRPSHRHAAPSAPWPWIDLADEVTHTAVEHENNLHLIPVSCDHSPAKCDNCWTGYPQSRFPNWTEAQVKRAKIYDIVHNYSKSKPCVCYRVDVNCYGFFTHPKELIAVHGEEDIVWRDIVHEQRPHDTRLRVLFIKDLSGPVLQMLSTKYNIDPLFWSSSLNWIPLRFQELKEAVGDHMTITLTFLHSISNHDAVQLAAIRSTESVHDASTLFSSQSVDRHEPLSNQRLLVLDLLSVHFVRNINGSTLISYHPSLNLGSTTAKFLHERICLTGQNIYWQSIFQKSQDPSFILLIFIWHAIYAWDEALENLYEHISSLESRVVSTPLSLISELLIIRAHHLHYPSLLDHCAKHVMFIKLTPNPAMNAFSEEDRRSSQHLLNRECDNLMTEIDRLNSELNIQERQLRNVIELTFSAINIADSRLMRQDSAAMKQIAYLTMVFLPATFATGIFGMNVNEITPGTKGTIFQYIALTLSFTALTAWIIIAFQSNIFPAGTSHLKRLAWPIFLFQTMISRKRISSMV